MKRLFSVNGFTLMEIMIGLGHHRGFGGDRRSQCI